MILKPRPVDLTEVTPHNIRHTSHRGSLEDMRVIVREVEDTAGAMDLPRGTSHFWLGFRPIESPERMLITFKDNHESRFVDRSLQFFALRTADPAVWSTATTRRYDHILKSPE